MERKVPFWVVAGVLCVVLFAVAYIFTEPNAALNPTIPSDTTEPPAETTVPNTQPSQTSTEDPPVPAYIVPENYPEITTQGYDLQAPVLPIPAEDAPEEEWIAFFYGMLSPELSWYNMGLISTYEQAKEVNLPLLFSLGIPVGSKPSELTDDEMDFLLSLSPYELEKEKYRLPASEMDSVLQIYFGVTLGECRIEDWFASRYYEKTDCYYQTGAANHTNVYGIVNYTRLENGDYCVRYVSDLAHPYGVADVVLHRVDDHFQIVSNVAVKEY